MFITRLTCVTVFSFGLIISVFDFIDFENEFLGVFLVGCSNIGFFGANFERTNFVPTVDIDGMGVGAVTSGERSDSERSDERRTWCQ